MGLILLEALLALALLVFFVWWTMFSGRRGGERPDHASNEVQHRPADPADQARASAQDKGGSAP